MKTWSDAEAHCQVSGGHVASVLSEEENHKVDSVAAGAGEVEVTHHIGHWTLEHLALLCWGRVELILLAFCLWTASSRTEDGLPS